MVIHRNIALALAVCAAAPGFAADPQPLDLATAMARARSQGQESTAAAARVRGAEADLRQARSARLPKLTLSETWLRTDSPADVFGMLLNQERFSFDQFVQSDPNRPDPLTTAVTRLEVQLPVWTGGEISARVRQARFAAEAAGTGATRATDSAAADAAEAWIRLAEAREAVSLLVASRETVAAHVELARDMAAQGMIVRSELLRAEVELANVDDQLAGARGDARVAEANLAFRLADPAASTYALAKLGDPPALPGEREAWVAAAARRPDLAAARHRLAAGELEAGARRAALLPHVGVVARHDLVDGSLFGAHGESTSLMAMASIQLFGGGQRAAAASARAAADAARADVDRFSEGVRVEAANAWEQAEVALQRRATAASALDAAHESVHIVEERFQQGVVKTIDVLDATTAEREAEMRELVARSDAWLSRVRLMLAAGLAPERALAADPLSNNAPAPTTPSGADS